MCRGLSGSIPCKMGEGLLRSMSRSGSRSERTAGVSGSTANATPCFPALSPINKGQSQGHLRRTLVLGSCYCRTLVLRHQLSGDRPMPRSEGGVRPQLCLGEEWARGGVCWGDGATPSGTELGDPFLSELGGEHTGGGRSDRRAVGCSDSPRVLPLPCPDFPFW